MSTIGKQISDTQQQAEVSGDPTQLADAAQATLGSIGLSANVPGLYLKTGNNNQNWKSIYRGATELEDFNITSFSRYSATAITANGGAINVDTAATNNDYTGVVLLTTGNNAAAQGRAAVDFFGSINKIRLAGAKLVFRFRVMIPVLSDGTTSFTFYCGLSDGTATGLPVNGVFFYYTHTVNAGSWQGYTRAASTASSVSSGTPVVAGQWYDLTAYVNTAGTEVSFYVDGEMIGSVLTTNIPASTTGMRFVTQIEKAALFMGTDRSSSLDYVSWKVG